MATDNKPGHSDARRDFLRKSLTLIPVATLASAGMGSTVLAATPAPAPAPHTPSSNVDDYHPTFFTQEEWAFLQAAVAHLIPNDDRGPGAVEAGVPEFIDRQMNTPYGAGNLWFMQGPFHTDAPPELGYQLKLSPQQLYRLGISETDGYCRKTFGKAFVDLPHDQQEQVLKALDENKATFEALPAGTFFSLLWSNTKEGFFCDPIHGGNKHLVGWKLINFPGARADFMDWVERDERYAYPPVSINGARS
ncbi:MULTISPECIES: gluconate 2-dehydrogenase subunit 3 family protein [Pseudomonas]|uniref:Gluconate 2-dehydrogenase subunit 3 family protein n=1 Tax=Pseudomonas quercus TaxID=2722792 RepID=A0ABX0YCJ7_9PSED|nr:MULTISPECIES: gluconate 2-dehydrogenase subunit 3 family protein [Pseudomonas]MBF7141575.1 gluconate 2-dehydrogenase subunit 3 family protein [Pseudomonas sp. LY10J]NJP00114.1 gluconate 2-dehydrogenase subunit 3 family protein [Pseudomonas quercus]